MEPKSNSILICVRVDRCCNRYWRCIFFLGFILFIVLVFTLLNRSNDPGPTLETNWQKHWSENQNKDAGSKQVFEPAGNVVKTRDESVDQYVAIEHDPKPDVGEYYDRDDASVIRSNYDQQYRNDEVVGKQFPVKPGSMGIVPDIHDYSLQQKYKFIFNTSVEGNIVFDDNYLNPCWSETIPKLPYQNNFYLKIKDQAKSLETSFTFMRQLFLKRSDPSNHWRLRCLPYFYIMEAPPMANPRLYNSLRFHPSIVNPEVTEPEFWNEKGPGGLATLRDYLDLFDTASENIRNSTTAVLANGMTVLKHKRITGDGTSSYLWTLNSWRRIIGNLGEPEPKTMAANLIKQLTPDARIIMVLRNPTERLFQGYLQRTENPSASDFHDKAGAAMTSLSDCGKKRSIRACVYDTFLNQRQSVRLRIGMYHPFVKDWINVFGMQQVKVIRYEDYVNNPSEVISDVCSFLGIPPYPTKDLESMEFLVKDMERKRKEREKLKMLSTTRRMLNDFHTNLNRQLADLLGNERFTWSDMLDDSELQRQQVVLSESKKGGNEKNEQQNQQDRERQEKERQAKEQQQRDQQQRDQQQRDQQQRDQQQRDQQQRDQQQRDQQQRDQQQRDQQQKDQQQRDQQQRDQQQRDQQQKDPQQKDQQQRDQQQRDQQQRDQQRRDQQQRDQQQRDQQQRDQQQRDQQQKDQQQRDQQQRDQQQKDQQQRAQQQRDQQQRDQQLKQQSDEQKRMQQQKEQQLREELQRQQQQQQLQRAQQNQQQGQQNQQQGQQNQQNQQQGQQNQQNQQQGQQNQQNQQQGQQNQQQGQQNQQNQQQGQQNQQNQQRQQSDEQKRLQQQKEQQLRDELQKQQNQQNQQQRQQNQQQGQQNQQQGQQNQQNQQQGQQNQQNQQQREQQQREQQRLQFQAQQGQQAQQQGQQAQQQGQRA